MKSKNFPGAKNSNRKGALSRLTERIGTVEDEAKQLILKKEIAVLQNKITSPEIARSTRTKKYRGA